jgi:hypothetical protein
VARRPARLAHVRQSKAHLGLPPLYDGPQADAMDALLGKDPKRIFEEPDAGEPSRSRGSKVRSSNVARVGWADGFLYVAYKSGGVYCYQGVDRDLFEVLLEPRARARRSPAAVKGRRTRSSTSRAPTT